MKGLIKYVCVAIFLISLISIDKAQETEDDENLTKSLGTVFDQSQAECNESIPILSIGEPFSDPENIKKSHKTFILSVSKPECED